MANDNLIELVDLFADDTIEWTPRDGEWSARVILMHIIGARYHSPIQSPDDIAHNRAGTMIANCRRRKGIKQELQTSWELLALILSDQAKLDAVYEVGGGSESVADQPAPPLLGAVERATAGMDLRYADEPEQYTGH